MRLLVIGATGFLGRHVRDRAIADGMSVITAARAPGAADVRISLTMPDLASVLGSVGPDAVVNCAGATRGSPAEMVAANVVGVARLQAALAPAGLGARLVHLGSAAEYGETPFGSAVSEDAPVRPVLPYGITKLAGTELIRAEGLDAVVLRIFNPVGPGLAATSLPGRLAAELRCAGDSEIRLGGLGGFRDFVDVRDVAAAAVSAAYAPGPLPPVLNVGSGRATRLRDLVGSLVTMAGGGRTVVEDPEQPGGVTWSQADISLIADALGWRPVTDLTTSLWDLWESIPPRR